MMSSSQHRPGRASYLPVLLAIGAVGAALLRPRAEEAAHLPVAPPATQPAVVVGPITYYNNNCNRCHGQVDAAYPDSKNPPKGEQLKQVIQEMAEGPAQAPLDEAALAEQVKLHEAIFGGGPYVWTPHLLQQSKDLPPVLSETIPGTKLVNRTEKGDVPIVVNGYQFSRPGVRTSIVAERNGKTLLGEISVQAAPTQPADSPAP
ncbi:MAG TPA: hypothetical protein VF624_10755 [Tepidisphaeraceae bacterium]|jgi:hypothetical protein